MVCVSAQQWQVLLWKGTACCESKRFLPGQDAIFIGWVQQYPNATVTLLTDLAEEHYHIEVLPHVRGHTRRQLLSRKLAAWPPAMGLHAVQWLDTSQVPRREDRYLCTAVSLDRWQAYLQALQQHAVCVMGVYLQSSFLGHWAHRLLPSATHVLCIHGHVSYCRFSYIHHGKVVFSRQVSLPEHAMTAALLAEIGQTRMYLVHQQWLPEAETLHLLMLSDAHVFASLPDAATLSDKLVQQHVTHAEMLRQLALPVPTFQVSAMAWLAMQGILRQGLMAANLANPALRITARIRSARRCLMAASVVMLVIGMMARYLITRQIEWAEQAYARQQQLLLHVQPANTSPPLSGNDAQRMQVLANAATVLIAAQRSPQPLLQVLQQACADLTAWQLVRVQWQYGPQAQRPSTVDWQEWAVIDFVQKETVSSASASHDWAMLLQRLRAHSAFSKIEVEVDKSHDLVDSLAGDTRTPWHNAPLRQRLRLFMQPSRVQAEGGQR